MCGVLGYSTNPGTSFSMPLADCLPYIRHRGPDDSGIYEDSDLGIGFAHTRLSILDTSHHGHQPMFSPNRKVALIFNGEIYNYRELRLELESEKFTFAGNSDTEVLLNLYLSFRDTPDQIELMLKKLNGIFAFALYDFERNTMLIVRDPFGVKPLYYASVSSGFLFASEIKALWFLMHAQDKDKEFGSDDLDFPSLDRYLTFLWCPGDGTLSSKVRKLDPGEALWVRNGKIDERVKWYRLPFSRHRSGSSCLSPTDAVTGTADNLRKAVHRQMVSDVPLGAFLSGGLDSSSVVAFARELDPEIRCFTIEVVGGQESGTTDDLPYARRVAEHLGVSLDVVRIDAGRMADDLQRMVIQLDEPLADPAPLNVLYISQLARDQGIKVLLSGAGGDDLFTGYRRHRALRAERWWSWLPLAARRGLAAMTQGLNQRHSFGRRLAKLFSGAGLTEDERLVNYFRWISRSDLLSLYSKEFREALNESIAEEPMLEFLEGLPPEIDRMDSLLALEQRFFLTDHNLTYTDKMSMAAGVEVRVPFLDLDLVEFSSRVPSRLKQRGGEGKWVLKKAMEPYLPRDVIYRSKTGFGAPLRRWMGNELRELLNDLLSAQSLKQRGLFDAAAVQRLIAANDAGKVDASYTLLSILSIEIWCRSFFSMKMQPCFGQPA
ncbi:MAG: asparagine synthase (glutamine-hydrolyzing) [Opitutae bacterium]|nr:asparagine synthase (glutamine-hydrolyzing) [Opitutae bacterium]